MDKEAIRADIIREIAELLFLEEEEVNGDTTQIGRASCRERV